MKKLFLLFLMGTAPVWVQAQIGAKTQQQVYGIWHNNDFGYQMTLMLQTDGSGEFDGEAIKHRIQGDQLFITQGGTTTAYKFVLNGNSLTVSGGDLDAPIVFAKSGSSFTQTTSTSTGNTTSTSAGIIGVWTNYGESIEFKTNGQCIYLGQTFNYQATSNQITLQTAQGNALINYVLQQNQLVLTVNGQKFTYAKAQGNTATTNTSNTTQATGNRQLDMTIVGKWCYVNVTSTNSGGTSSDACITIRENGTYEYYAERSMSANATTFSSGTASQSSDSGTWWVQGNRVFYQSQTQGQGSYELIKRNHPKTGDPMLVLDGTTYVTFYQKSPW